jgi:Domain of unknown function (DUF4226)
VVDPGYFQGMVEQAGQSAAALQARAAALADRHAEIASADRALAEAVAAAHSVATEALAALGRIEAEIESAVAAHVPEDGPAAARQLQRLLIDKQREIASVVADAQTRASAKAAAVQELTDSYRTPV